ncbi:MAG: acyl-CoA dehydrogenase family protein [Myxococcota bacterium]|nr:acyl-CoA dehydrogenase [Deltaproteobacteria bacterium]MCP4241320.1 acyl-CoA dehydrogenase [bacterium]MDP6075824.1 acyl-CoA dehydrogenase family protein [Myxococcota bacterium]MDP6244488.1 acyl-CoA dehydrogenase family protein [Myxococcota bacterium]MDP7075112.1 acyl-CoA dehydrogenase family protein [Myxococcota bacterium]
MADLETFRTEAAAWLDANAPLEIRGLELDPDTGGGWGGRRATFDPPQLKDWLDRCAEKGWTAPQWPREYGGGGLSGAEARVLDQERKRLQLPEPLVGFGLTMIGPVLLQFGTEEQRQEHLTKIVRGEIRWCQGYSEPDSGSDLASLQTRAVRDGDEFVVNGTKVWTSYGDLSDWIFALVRTNPDVKKQEGISFLLIDMQTPGVAVRPIQLISGKSPFCETRFDDVRVPVANVIGEIDGGWTVAKALLGHERAMIADLFGAPRGGSRKAGSSLVNLAREYLDVPDDAPLSDAVLRDKIAASEMDTRAFHLTIQRSRDAAKAGHQPGPESSIFKVYATEANKRRCELAVELAGPRGLGWEGPGFEADELARTRAWLRSRGNSIEGGTSEIQLNIIAKRVLGLPD